MTSSVAELHLEKKISDEDMKLMKGQYVDDSSYDVLITDDCDVYDHVGRLLLKFRKKIMSDEEIDIGFHSFKNMAKPSRGRGAAAGLINPDDQYWKNRKLVKFSKWSANYETPAGEISKMKIQHEVASNPIGYFGKTNMGNKLPCRLSYFTQNDFMKYQSGIPYIQNLSESYRNLNPKEYDRQLNRANLNPHLKIEGTPFSTITVNRNFRTGIHQDSGDFGFGNLSCLEYGAYSGGYFVMPQYKVAVDMRAGDHLCCDVHQYHANTELHETESDKIINDNLVDIYHDNLNIGVKGLNNRYARISLVCYLREDLVKCDSPSPSHLTPVFPTKNVFYINLKKDMTRRKKFISTNYVRWDASIRTDVSQELDKKMVSYHNLPREDHLGKCACFLSHVNLLKKIIEYKINSCYILEDDAIQIGSLPLPKKLSSEKFTYLGGFIMNRKITSTDPVEIVHKKGINTLDEKKHQMLMALSYFIPTWQVAEQMLNHMLSQDRYRAYDVMLFKSHPSEYIHPAIFVEEHVESNLRKKKNHHCNDNYEFIHHKKIKLYL
tara:strand:+ start:46 stop:1692 length:1647 start_codon:yes stop_codon:yes gene_type:complete